MSHAHMTKYVIQTQLKNALNDTEWLYLWFLPLAVFLVALVTLELLLYKVSSFQNYFHKVRCAVSCLVMATVKLSDVPG